MWSLGPLAFSTPWVLAALAALPALWWLLRVTPPAPRRVRFPALRLLMGLPQDQETPARTPLWLLILRFVIATLVVLGLARPLVNPANEIRAPGPIVVIVDDGWAAARGWTERQKEMTAILEMAERAGREVALLGTAPAPARAAPEPPTLLPAAVARERARAIEPKPWATDRRAALVALEALKLDGRADIWWLADGVEDGASEAFSKRLMEWGALTVMSDGAEKRPRMLAPPGSDASGLLVRLWRVAAFGPETLLVRAVSEDGRVIAREPVRFEADATEAAVTLALPPELRNRVARLDIDGEASAGAVALVDERWRRRPVGLAVLRAGERDLPLLGEVYYLERALAPTSDVRAASLDALLAQSISTIILPDTGALPEPEQKALDAWVKAGGVLVRFAGPRLIEGADELLPVTLRRGGRSLGGTMSWGEPARLQPFAPNSPFAGLAVPQDVEVLRQVLAQPAPDLDSKTWARLGDGTPLVTGTKHGQGFLVLFHVTANPEWSTLAFSGLFVEMLQRLVAMSAGAAGNDSTAPLPPLEVLDGFGHLKPPLAGVRSIAGKDMATAVPGPETPPGLYGTATARRALNLSAALGKPAPMAELPRGAVERGFGAEGEVDLMPWLLAAALLLMLVDLAVSLVLRGTLAPGLRHGGTEENAPAETASGTAGSRRAAFWLAATVATGLALAASPRAVSAQANEDPTGSALKAVTQTRLAYVRTGNAEIDRASRAGLTGLRRILGDRTAVELGDAAEVDINSDELAFYPLLYWPVARGQAPVAPQTAQKVYAYIRNGGLILFDTQDQQTTGMSLGEGADSSTRALQRLLGRLNLAPLVPVPVDHVLTRSFYLLPDFPGRWTGGRVWVEDKPASQGESVSAVIVGGHDWAGAWAMDEQGRPQFPVVPGGEKQREIAYRFGVNVVMYALTGNYKLDQVHMRFIMERLDR
jgi:hypothetical protein